MVRKALQQGLIAAAGVFAVVVLAAAYVWRADIHQAFLDPGVPYQTYKPPPAPDYATGTAWALMPDKPTTWGATAPVADVFFVHPTTYDGGRHWNGPVHKTDRVLAGTMLPNYAGPFSRVGRVFAPRYRQASLYTQVTSREDAREARAFAYRDVQAAFRFYLQHYNRGRPVIVVGVEQGGFLAQRLVREAVADPVLARRLIAAYLIETAVPREAPPLAPCAAAGQVGCLVAWVSVTEGEPRTIKERLRHSVAWNGERADLFGDRKTLCVNPVTGVVDGVADARAHRGGVNASKLEWGIRPAFLAHQVAARCVDGLLQISRPRSPSLRPAGDWVERTRAQPYSTFYADLEADAQARTAALMAQPGFGRLAPPIDSVIEIKPAIVR